jgi:predicted dinucleotide-binding enzyme
MAFTRRHALGMLAAIAALPALTPLLARASQPLRIGVIGAGWLGSTVGKAWVRAGHEVMFSSRHPEALASMAKALGPRASVGTPAQAAAFGEVLLFAVPYDALPVLGRDLQASLRGKVVLDACNPPATGSPLAQEAAANGVGQTSAKYLAGTKLVRAFSAVDASAIEVSNGKLGVPLASNDPQALKVAEQLVRDADCVPVVVGDLAAAIRFQRGGPGFRANTDARNLRRLLGLPEA